MRKFLSRRDADTDSYQRGWALGGLAGLLIAAIAAIPPAGAQVIPTSAALQDFMIQNVCLDAAGVPLVGVSPIDGNPACVSRRNLLPGELLPYHKDDQPSPADRAAAPLGYQRHDSFPVETAGAGTVVEDSLDFGGGEHRRFGVFDPDSDGGDIVVMSPGAVSIAATRDASGFIFWVGECHGAVTAHALSRSWLIADYDPQRLEAPEGHALARLNAAPANGPAACPAHLNAAYTSWRLVPFRYDAAPGQGRQITLTTLISDHYGGADPATADHVERFYFTRELGGTRWERWQNAAGDAQFSAAQVARQAALFASTGRCSPAPMPEGGANMLMIDCREWTNIVPPTDPAGDPPGFFLAAMRARPGLPALFAAPAGRH